MPGKPAPVNGEDPIIDYLKNARDIAFVAAVFLYYMGWIYIYYYLNAFGIPSKAVGGDVYYVLIYSSDVFINLYNFHKVGVVLAIGLVVFVAVFKYTAPMAKRLLPLFVALLFPLVFYIAKTAAEENATLVKQKPLDYLNNISFVFKDIKPEDILKKGVQPDENIAANTDARMNIVIQNNAGRFRLVIDNGDEYYVLHTGDKNPTPEQYKDTPPDIFVIKKDMVEFAEITK